MLRIAIQSKGRLNEDSMALLSESGIKLSPGKRTLLVQSPNFPIEVLFLRDDDIPDSVASGVADVGIVGMNEFLEKERKAEVVKELGFSKCRLSLAIPKEVDYPGLSWFNGRKIATSYPVILLIPGYPAPLPGRKQYLGRYTHHHRFGRDCPRHRIGRRHIRHCKLGKYLGEQQPARSRGRREIRGGTHCHARSLRREKGDTR